MVADGEVRQIYVPNYMDTDSDEELYFQEYYGIPVIEVKGENVPAPIKSFDESGLHPLIIENVKSNYEGGLRGFFGLLKLLLAKVVAMLVAIIHGMRLNNLQTFGIDISKNTWSTYEQIPTPIQQNSIPIVMAKRDMMACAQLGTGFTTGFLLPIIHNIMQDGVSRNSGSTEHRPQAVILAATRELAIQILCNARKFSMGTKCKSVVAYGEASVLYQKSVLKRSCNILVATPGRLLDLVEKGFVSLASLQYFVLVEVDRMIDMGFMPDIEKCMALPEMPSTTNRNTLMFSATFPLEVQSIAEKFMRKDKIFVAIRKLRRKSLDKILNDEERDPTECALIFVNTKKTADFSENQHQ